MNEVQVLLIEIAVIVTVIAFFSFIIGRYVYRKIKGLPTGECACCHKSSKKLLKEYHKFCCSKK